MNPESRFSSTRAKRLQSSLKMHLTAAHIHNGIQVQGQEFKKRDWTSDTDDPFYYCIFVICSTLYFILIKDNIFNELSLYNHA